MKKRKKKKKKVSFFREEKSGVRKRRTYQVSSQLNMSEGLYER